MWDQQHYIVFIYIFPSVPTFWNWGIIVVIISYNRLLESVCVCVCCDGSLEFSIMQMTKNCVKYIALNLNSAIV